MSERMSKIIFSSSAWQLFSSWKPVQNLSYTVNFFAPDSLMWDTTWCVDRAEKDKDSYRKNAKMTYYLFCPPFHSESKELTTERTTWKKTNVCNSIFWFFAESNHKYIPNLKIIIKPLNDEEQGRKVVIQKINIIICSRSLGLLIKWPPLKMGCFINLSETDQNVCEML